MLLERFLVAPSRSSPEGELTMSQRPRAAQANALELWTGLAAGIFGFIGLGVYLFVPTLTQSICPTFGGLCNLHSAAKVAQIELVAALFRLWAPLFLVVAVGAIWDGLRRAVLGRVLLWLGTLLLLAVTVPGLYFGRDLHRGNLFFVPGIVFALVASAAAVAYRR
jgi:hypothetical protein